MPTGRWVMHDRVFHTVPEIETRRLLLKEICHKDAHQLYQLFTDERVIKTFGYRMEPSIVDAHNLIDHWRKLHENGQGMRWGMYLKPFNKLIGNLGFKNVNGEAHVNIGYALMPYYWRRGFTYEAMVAIIDELFEHLNVRRIEATVLTNNTASINLLHKLGFNRIAYLKNNYFFDSAFHDVYVYTLDNEMDTSDEE